MVASASSASVTEVTWRRQNARVEFQAGLDGSCPQAWPSVVWPPMILQLGTNLSIPSAWPQSGGRVIQDNCFPNESSLRTRVLCL